MACPVDIEPELLPPRPLPRRAERLTRIEVAERRIDGCIAYTALVRYDAYGDLSGQQSSSMALLDARRTGVVVSSILHRDQARMYVKQVREGASPVELSPEELEAIDAALAGADACRAGA